MKYDFDLDLSPLVKVSPELRRKFEQLLEAAISEEFKDDRIKCAFDPERKVIVATFPPCPCLPDGGCWCGMRREGEELIEITVAVSKDEGEGR